MAPEQIDHDHAISHLPAAISTQADRFVFYGGTAVSYPEPWFLPAKPPTEDQWLDALRHQCVPQVSAAEAYETVTNAWGAAAARAKTDEQP